MDRKEIETALQACEFFRGLANADLRKIARLGKPTTYQAGDFIFRQGDPGEEIHVIVNGRVHLERAVDLGTRKGRVVIDTLGNGRFLGCWSTLLARPHILMSSACCQEPTTVVTLNGADLRALMQQNGELGFNVMERLCLLLRDRIQAAYGAMEKI